MSRLINKIKIILKRKRIALLIIGVILLLGLNVSIFWYLYNNLNNKVAIRQNNLTTQEKINNAVVASIQQSPESGIKYYDDQINSTTSNTEKRILLTGKSAVYYNQQQYDKALEVALQADSLGSTEDTCQFIAKIYVALNNKPKALEYYKKAITLISPEDPLSNYYRKQYESAINDLER